MKKAIKAMLLTTSILLSIAAHAANCIPAPSGLVGWWTGDNNLQDLSPYRNDIANLVNVVTGSGKVGSGFLINGSNSEIIIPQSPSLTITSLTFTAWVNPRDLSTMRPIIEYGNVGDWSGVQLAALAGGELFVNIRDSSNPWEGHADLYYTGGVGTGRSLPLNSWSFVAATFDALTARSRLYLNGVLLNGPDGTYLPSTFSRRTDSRLNIGFRPDTSFDGNAGHRFDGMIDEVQVFNRALSAAEIVAIYNAGADGQCRPGGNIPSPPQIISQPESMSVAVGGTAIFKVDALSLEPVAFQWVKGALAINGATSNFFPIINAQLANAGDYRVVVSNKFGIVLSSVAKLTVTPDNEAPRLTITSPPPGISNSSGVILAGTATDNVAVTRFEIEYPGRLQVITNQEAFSMAVNLVLGTNIIKVTAFDAAGNRGTETVTVIYEPRRTVSLDFASARERNPLLVPLLLTNLGQVGAMELTIGYDPTYLTYTNVQWARELGQFNIANEERPGLVHLSFALSGSALATGTLQIASINFRARSVPQTLSTPLDLKLLGVYSPSGDPVNDVTDVISRNAVVYARRFVGDNNANDQLDIADAYFILSFIAGLSPVRPWDISGNDLNQNAKLDSGDVVRVLRAAAGIDPQPSPLSLHGLSPQTLLAPADLRLVAEKSVLIPGEKILVKVALDGMEGPLFGASFKLDYPKEALRLESATAHRAGSLVPSSASGIWNLSPAVDDYTRQDGTVQAAFVTATAWPANSGDLAVFEFVVLEQAAMQPEWSIQISRINLACGLDLQTAPPSELKFKSGTPALRLTTAAYHNGVFQFSLLAEIGSRYRVETSDNLSTWTELAIYENQTGEITVRDSSSNAGNRRYYRAIRIAD